MFCPRTELAQFSVILSLEFSGGRFGVTGTDQPYRMSNHPQYSTISAKSVKRTILAPSICHAAGGRKKVLTNEPTITYDTDRSIDDTLKLGWDLLSNLPKAELNRIDEDLIAEHYREGRLSFTRHRDPPGFGAVRSPRVLPRGRRSPSDHTGGRSTIARGRGSRRSAIRFRCRSGN